MNMPKFQTYGRRCILVNGNHKNLSGKIDISGSKNASLPILASAPLLNSRFLLKNVPKIQDVTTVFNILEYLNVTIHVKNNCAYIDSSSSFTSIKRPIPYDLCQKTRASILFLGSLLSRFHKAALYYPGGCKLGFRPIDYHIEGLKKLGVEFYFNGDLIVAKAKKIKGTTFELPFPSVGATENLIMASIFANDKVTLMNASIEPEVVDLINFLNASNAQIKLYPKERIVEIYGVNPEDLRLKTPYTVISDRIEAITYAVLCASLGGELLMKNVPLNHIGKPLDILRSIGVDIRKLDEKSIIISSQLENLESNLEIVTGPYPEFPTDAHPIFVPLLLRANGTTILKERVYKDRFQYVNELKKMSANIILNEEDRSIIINGEQKLHGAKVRATDLRGGMALMIAASYAEGSTIIADSDQIMRGYEDVILKFRSLGVDVYEC